MENVLELLWAYIVVFLLGAVPFIEAVLVIPVAILAGLSPIPVFLLALAGNFATVLLIILFIDQIKQWRHNRRKAKGETSDKRSMRAQKIWQKYGLPGLAVIGPFFVGSHLTAFMSVMLGGKKHATAVWMGISLIAWGAVFAVLGYLGLDVFNVENPILERFFAARS